MKIIDKVLDEKSDVALAFFWQIIGPLFILCTFALDPNNLIIFSVGILGLFLSSKFQMKGFVAALIVLSIAAIGEHLFFKTQHLWSLGIEGSYAIAFFITAQNADRHHSFINTLLSQIETRTSSILNLEEEFTKSRSDSTEQQVLLQEKIDLLQKQVDEALSDQSSLLILNEVLRKTTASHVKDHNTLKEQLFDLESRLELERTGREEAEADLLRLKNESVIIQDNQRLTDEINAIRMDREQTHMINETLARLHAKENMRAQSACDQMTAYESEKRQLDTQLSTLKRELESLRFQLEQAISERDRYQQSAQRSDAIQTERNFLKDRLRMAEHELSQRKENPASIDLSQYVPKDVACKLEDKIKELSEIERLYSQLKTDQNVEKEIVPRLEEKVKELSQIELLYKQLKVQFDEKNQTLHKTRSELFHVDNTLQTLKIDMQRNELMENPLPQEILSEITSLESEISDLAEENEELQSLVTALSATETTSFFKRKKKVKVIPDQEYLF